ncbi:MAG TPA: cation:dicarboxylase symporter family transporter, partial [Gemmatimonadaceae bacterium]|nr:cation:dicarboxylase symporter family transporter [Gemmatimonadaceae bacterium]
MRRLHKNLTFQVLVAIAIGIALGVLAPDVAKKMKPVGDTFVNLVKMVIAPVVFLTIVLGIANMHDLKRVGRVGGKALLYFEIVTTFALLIGLVVVNVLKPGEGLAASTLAKGDISAFVTQGKSMNFADFLTHIVPSSMMDAFAKGDVLQVVFVAVLFGVALALLGD